MRDQIFKMPKLPIVSIELLTSGGCDGKGKATKISELHNQCHNFELRLGTQGIGVSQKERERERERERESLNMKEQSRVREDDCGTDKETRENERSRAIVDKGEMNRDRCHHRLDPSG